MKNFGSFLQNYNSQLNDLLRKNYSTSAGLCDDEENNDTPVSDVASSEEHTSIMKIITIDYSNRENINLIDLLRNDNKFLNKILLTYGSLGEEVDYLKSFGNKLLNQFLYSDDNFTIINPTCMNEHDDIDQMNENAIIMQISKQLELLFTIRHFMERCQHIGDYILKQIIGLCNYDDNKYINIQKSLQYNVS